MRFNSLAFVTSGLILTASLAVAQATKSLTGTVSDAMCGKTHMMKGESAAQCTRECVKSGSDYALHDRLAPLRTGMVPDLFSGEVPWLDREGSGRPAWQPMMLRPIQFAFPIH